jgi:hypothetical protein
MNIKIFIAPKVYTCYKKMQEKVNKVKKSRLKLIYFLVNHWLGLIKINIIIMDFL